jgi:hypothetical protein
MKPNVGSASFFQLFSFPDRCAIRQNVDPSELLDSSLDQSLHLHLICQVGMQWDCFDPATLKKGDGFGCLLGRGPIVNNQVVASLGQRIGHIPADAPLTAAGDESHG